MVTLGRILISSNDGKTEETGVWSMMVDNSTEHQRKVSSMLFAGMLLNLRDRYGLKFRCIEHAKFKLYQANPDLKILKCSPQSAGPHNLAH